MLCFLVFKFFLGWGGGGYLGTKSKSHPLAFGYHFLSVFTFCTTAFNQKLPLTVNFYEKSGIFLQNLAILHLDVVRLYQEGMISIDLTL